MSEEGTDTEPQCPIRHGDSCSLCVPGATSPEDCGLVYLVMSDAELRKQCNEGRQSVEEH